MDNASGDLAGQLTAALRHARPEVRGGAALALGRLGQTGAMEALIGALADPRRLVYQSAAQGLALLGAPAAGALLALIQDPPFGQAAERAALALAQIRDPAAAGILVAALSYPEARAREGSLSALAGIRDPEALPAITALALDEESDLRPKAVVAVMGYKDPQMLYVPIALLGDPDPRLRQMAVEGVGEAGGEDALLPLLTMLNDADEHVRTAAYDALRRIEIHGTSDILLTALNTNTPWVRQAIMEALSGFQGPEVLEVLIRIATEEGDLASRLTAAQMLAVLGDPRGRVMIRRTFNAPNVETRRLAAIALGMTGELEAVDFLLTSVSTREIDLSSPYGRYLRYRVLLAIEHVGKPAVRPLIERLDDPDALRRQIASDSLVRIGPAAVPDLGDTVLMYPSILVRVQAARILAEIGDRDGLDALVTVLRTALLGPFPVVFFSRLFVDRSAPVRRAAALALGRMGFQDGAAVLLSAARFDPDSGVRTEASRALARIGAPMVMARFAQPDILGQVNRGIAAAISLLLAAFLSAGPVLLFGVRDLAPLTGLGAGAVLGLSDGLNAERRPVRLALFGCAVAWLLAWVLRSTAVPDWVFPLIAFGLPSAGALLGWVRTSLVQRLAGLFAGMILGFAGALVTGLFLRFGQVIWAAARSDGKRSAFGELAILIK